MRAALPPGRRLRNALARLLLWLSAAAACALLLLIAGYIFFRGAPGVSLELLTGRDSVLEGTVGILPSILNTLYVIAASLAIVTPVGVGAAIYLTEYAKNRRLAGAIEFAAETLAGIPSILYAMMGTMVFCTALGLQRSLKAVPRSYREGALGLGAGQWRAIRTVVLPSSLDGIVTGCILAVGRVVGESAVLMYTAGLSTAMQDFSNIQGLMRASGATLTVALYVYAKERSDFAAAFSVATVLLVLTALLNLTAFLIGRRVPRREGGGHG